MLLRRHLARVRTVAEAYLRGEFIDAADTMRQIIDVANKGLHTPRLRP